MTRPAGRGRWLLAGVAAMLLACSSPNSQFFALDPTVPHAGPPPPGGTPLVLSTLHLPPILDRPELVRRGAGDAVEISPQQRWAAPLDEMAFQVLNEDLAAQGIAVVAPGMPPPAGPHHSLSVSLDRFDADAHGTVVLEGDWTLAGTDGSPPLLERHERIVQPAGAGQAAGMSAALGELARRIAAGLNNQPAAASPASQPRTASGDSSR